MRYIEKAVQEDKEPKKKKKEKERELQSPGDYTDFGNELPPMLGGNSFGS